MKKYLFCCVLLLTIGCQMAPWTQFGASVKPLKASEFVPSGLNDKSLPMDQGFVDYVKRAKTMIARARVFFDSSQRDREILLNAPFEILPSANDCPASSIVGLIMVHGLSGSPMVWRDLSRKLATGCVHVRAVLLPGHGTRAADLMTVSHEDWLQTVRQAVRQLRPHVTQVFVAGFSMGGTIATILAHQGEPIDGLVLLAPAFRSRSLLQGFTPFFAHFVDWLDKDPIEEPARYDALPMLAAAEFHRLTEKLERYDHVSAPLRIPVYMALSSDDIVIDLGLALDSFRGQFTSPKSRMLLIGNPSDTAGLIERGVDNRISIVTSYLPKQRVLKFSHLAMPFSPTNFFYGQGKRRTCKNYEPGTENFELCKTSDEFYYTNARDDDGSPVKFRLTFNPYFDELSGQIAAFLKSK